MDTQSSNNYSYYDNGSLKSDSADFIETIHWNVANKIDRIVFMADSSKPDQIIFRYDAMGERALKLVQPDLSDTTTWAWTYYVRDAQGNVLTTYERSYFEPAGSADPINYSQSTPWDSLGTLTSFKASEYHLYGSDRIGIYAPELFVAFHDGDSLFTMPYGYDPYAYDGDPCGCDTSSTCSSPPCDPCWCEDNDPCGCPPCLNCDDCYCTGWPTTDFSFTSASHQVRAFVRGKKRYELKNHLGNVLSVISDRKIQHTTDSSTVDYYLADIWAYHDYYPFGMALPGRNWQATNYRYGFQGQEADDEVFGEDNAINYTFRMYDARIGRFLSIDPLAGKYPWNSPYAFSENRVIDAVELEGLEMIPTWGLEYQHISVEQATKARFYEAAGLGVGAAIWAIPAISTWAIFNPVTAEETFRSGLEIATNTDMGPTANDFFTYTWKHGVVEIAEELPGAWKRFKGWIGRGFRSAKSQLPTNSSTNDLVQEGVEFVDDGIRMLDQPLTNGIREFSTEAANNLVVNLKNTHGGNVTVMKDGNPVFRVHQPNTHGNANATITRFNPNQNPISGRTYYNPEPNVSPLDDTSYNILMKASNLEDGYELTTKGGR